MTDRELLIRIDERVAFLHDKLCRHLRRHWQVALAVLAAVVAAGGTWIVAAFGT